MLHPHTDPSHPQRATSTRFVLALGLAWKSGSLRLGVAIATPALAAIGFGLTTPRGPLTATAGITSMLTGLAVGGLAGLALRSRWALLVAPVVFIGVFELVRLGTDGPTVDGIHLSTYGLMALVVGRGIHGVIVLLPMLLGATVGAAAARHRTRSAALRRAHGWIVARRSVTALTALGLIALAVLIVRPASTDAIVGGDGTPLAGSVAELTRVPIGGHDLALMLRGDSFDNPVLLFLAGGPGGSELGAMRNHLQALEKSFLVVTFDQRGSGKSYAALDPTSTLTLDTAVSETIEVTNYLRTRFGQDRIYLLGQSWGTTLGVLAAQRHPELYRAFIGAGQMVSQRETDRIIYRDTLAWAEANGKTDIVSTLTRIGEPPYRSILDYEPALSYEHEVYPYDRTGNSEGEGGFSENLFAEEYTLLEQIHNLGAFLDSFTVLYPQLQQIDFRRQVTKLDIPVYLVQGRYEARGRAELATEWFANLQAPSKKLIVVDHTGHRPLFERPAEFVAFMTDTVLAETGAGR